MDWMADPCTPATLLDALWLSLKSWPDSLGSGFGLSNYDRLMLSLSLLLFYGPMTFAIVPLSKPTSYRGKPLSDHPDHVALHQASRKMEAEQRRRDREQNRAKPIFKRFGDWLKQTALLQLMKYLGLYSPILILVVMPTWYANILIVAIALGWLQIWSEHQTKGLLWMTAGLAVSVLGFGVWRLLPFIIENKCLL